MYTFVFFTLETRLNQWTTNKVVLLWSEFEWRFLLLFFAFNPNIWWLCTEWKTWIEKMNNVTIFIILIIVRPWNVHVDRYYQFLVAIWNILFERNGMYRVSIRIFILNSKAPDKIQKLWTSLDGEWKRVVMELKVSELNDETIFCFIRSTVCIWFVLFV